MIMQYNIIHLLLLLVNCVLQLGGIFLFLYSSFSSFGYIKWKYAQIPQGIIFLPGIENTRTGCKFLQDAFF